MLKPLTVWITTNSGQFLKKLGYQTTLFASWEICVQVEKQQSEPAMEQQTGSKLEKEYIRVYIVTCLFNFCAEYIMWNAGLDESQAGIKISGRNINNLRWTDDIILMSESEEEQKSPLRVKEEVEKAGLKLTI